MKEMRPIVLEAGMGGMYHKQVSGFYKKKLPILISRTLLFLLIDSRYFKVLVIET